MPAAPVTSQSAISPPVVVLALHTPFASGIRPHLRGGRIGGTRVFLARKLLVQTTDADDTWPLQPKSSAAGIRCCRGRQSSRSAGGGAAGTTRDRYCLTMRLLVTGGAGFIGANSFATPLIDRPQVSITVLDALTYAGSRESLASVADDIRSRAGKRHRRRSGGQAVADADAVVHFAAETHVDNALA